MLDLGSKRRKRIKANEENAYGYSYGGFPSSWRYDLEQKRGHFHTKVLNNSEPFTTNDLLFQLDSGKFGSVTREIEELIKRRRQLLDSFYAVNPELPAACSGTQTPVVSKHSEVGAPVVIDLDDDNIEAQLSHLAAPVVVIDSDDDDDARGDILGVDLKPPPCNLQDFLIKDKPSEDFLIKDKPSGYLLMKNFLVMNLSYSYTEICSELIFKLSCIVAIHLIVP